MSQLPSHEFRKVIHTAMDLNYPQDELVFVWVFLLILSASLVLVLYYASALEIKSKHNPVVEDRKPYKVAALASTSELCEKYVIEAFREGASAADAAIIALTIQGLTSPQSLGLGGGFLLLYYDRKKTETHVLNAREYSPSATTNDMFRNCRTPAWGGLASAVPGEIQGYWELHKRFGKLPWHQLFEPAIKLCEHGIPVPKITGDILLKIRTHIMNSPTLKEMFCDPNTGDVYKCGDLMKRPTLARTLEMIGMKGAEAFYNGELTKQFVKDIQENGGIITVEDLNNYKAKWTSPLSLDVEKNRRIYTTPRPGSGQVLLAILDIIFSLGKSESPGVNWFRIVETWKHAFGQRSVMDGPRLHDALKEEKYDPSMAKIIVEFIKKKAATSQDVRQYSTHFEKLYREGGTCHVSLLAPNGDAVSVTSSINYAFGAMYASKSTGIIMNNHMMDFAVPDLFDKFYISNQLEPNKQPVSCMVPTIIINSKTKDANMVIGAAGGFKILTAASQVILEILLFDIPQASAIAHRRLHHQLVPMVLFHEEEFPKHILDEMRKYGHHVEKILPGTSVAVITVGKNGIRADGDPRRLGSSAGY